MVDAAGRYHVLRQVYDYVKATLFSWMCRPEPGSVCGVMLATRPGEGLRRTSVTLVVTDRGGVRITGVQ